MSVLPATIIVLSDGTPPAASTAVFHLEECVISAVALQLLRM